MISVRCLFKQPFLLAIILLTVSFAGSSFGIAQAQSQTPGIKKDRAVYPESTAPIVPSAGHKFSDPVFGAEIMRATAESDCPAPGCGTYYNQWPTFNSDNTRILIRNGVNGDMIIKSFDPTSFTLGPTLRRSPILPGGATLEWQGATWSHTDPDLMFVHVSYYNPNYPATGMKLYTYRPSTNSFTLIRDFAPELAPGQPDYLFEMHADDQQEIFTFMHNRVGQSNNPIYFFVWKRSTNTVLKHILNDSQFDANNCIPDKSGRWVYCGRNQTGPNGERAQVLDLLTDTWQTIYWNGSDDAASHGDIGTGILIGHGAFSGSAVYRKLTDVHATTHHFDYKDANGIRDWSNDQHMSLYADDENWAMMGMFDDPDLNGNPEFETGAFENEVMQIALDGSQRVRRLFHHRSHIKNTSETNGYWACPKPTISKNGRFIAFTSNWGDSGRYDLFIAKIEPAASEGIANPTPTPDPTPIATPAASPTVTPLPVSEFIWFDDALPANAAPNLDNESWNWVSSGPFPYSGAAAVQSRVKTGFHQQTFSGASATMRVNVGDILFAYVFIDPSNRPREIMLQWKANEEYWDHRAYWGTNDVDLGSNGTNGRRWMGALPPGGGWIRLEVPASQVGLESRTVDGMAFTLYDGRATWDRAGKFTPGLPASTPTPTPTATPTPSPSPTPTPALPPPASLAMTSWSFSLASDLAASSLITAAQIAPLVNSVNETYAVFALEQNRFISVDEIDRDLRAALYFARGAGALAQMNGLQSSIQNRINVVVYYLSRAKIAMSDGVPGSANLSLVTNSLSFDGTPIIGPAEARSSASFAPVLAPASLGTILGDPNQSPLSAQTAYATLSAAAELPYELNGVSVAIGGRAARLISVSPSRIYFTVPADLPMGDAEVIVTSREGYVSRGMTTIAAVVPGLFTSNGDGLGDAMVLNAVTLMSGEFNVTTTENFGTDKWTRLMIFASGLSNGGLNTNIGNDVSFGAGILPNIAESVVVEARTLDNRVFHLPVEFVGSSGRSHGLDQINVRLINELRGAGSVEITLIIAGHRSNMAMIKVV